MSRWIAAVGAFVLAVGSMAGAPVASAASTFTPAAAEAELMRLLAGERAATGLPALAVDPFLASVARDATIACPAASGVTTTMQGRSKDMALNEYFNHQLRLCPTYSILDAFWAWGYRSMYGENVAMNSGYDYNTYPYQYGCDIYEANCTGTNTTAPTTVALAAHQFMSSKDHRALALSTAVDRFACGAWRATNGDHYYTCLYAQGPGSMPAPSPTPTPTPTPSPTDAPAPTATPPPPTPTPDGTEPSVTSLTAPTVVTSIDRSFGARWTATDNKAVTGYVVSIRKGSGTWSTKLPQTTTTRTFSGLSSGTWHVGVRARDAGGNWSDLRQTTVIVPTDDRAYAFSSGNVRRTAPRLIKGTETTTRRAGARMTIKFTGSSFVLIGSSSANRGKLRVVIDGRAYAVDQGYYKGSRATTTH